MIKTLAVLLAVRGGAGFKAQMSQASGSVKKFEKDIEGSGSRTSKFASGLKTALAGLAVAAALFFANAINQAVQFEGAMRNVNSISYLSEKQLSSLSNQVIALSTKVPQSAKVLAEGLYDIASSGFQGSAGMKVLESSALAASAGLTDTATSAKAITQVLNAYGLSASDAADVSDVLFQTVNVGVVTFEELANQLGDVVGGAAAAGVAIDEVGAAVAAMTLSGLGAAESTTSLNNLIRSLIKPSDGLAAAYRNLGIESGEAELKEKGLHGVMEELRVATHGNITTLIQLFPEIRAARGAFALMANEGQNYAKTFDSIADKQNRAGATQRAFNEQMKGLGQQWKLFTNQINAASIKIGLALIPALKEGLAAGREFGSTLADWFRKLATIAEPTVKRMGEALESLLDALKTIVDVAKPAAVALGAMAGAAILGGLTALSVAIKTIADVLAAHPGLVKAVALVYGTVLVGRLAAAAGAFIKLQASLMYIRAGLVALSAQSLLASLVTRVTALGVGLRGLFTGNVVEQTFGLGTAFSGLSTALAGIATAAIVAGVYAITTGLMNAKQNAQDLVKTVNEDLDEGSLDSISDALKRNTEAWQTASDTAQSYKGVFGVIRGATELLTPMENSLVDSSEATKALADNAEHLEKMQANLSLTTGLLAQNFGLTIDEAIKLAEALKLTGEQDPLDEEVWDEITQKVEDFRGETAEVPASLSAVADATGEVADITSTATDRLSALEDAMKGLFGASITAREAEAKLAGSIADLGKSVDENGLTFDIWTEKGRANEDALRGNIDAMIDLANATAQESGSVTDGISVLGLYRQQLLDNLVSMGLSKQSAEDLLATYGLTPANLDTLVQLEGVDEAQSAMTDLQGMLNAIGEAQATGKVHLDTSDFEGNAEAITTWIEQIALSAPEATVYLDDEPFQATAAQVTAWAQKYDDSSPEAQALLNIIDPEHKYHSLSDAADNWGHTATSGTAGLHDHASAPIAANKMALERWGRQSGSGTAGLHDNASSQLHGILSNLNAIDGRSVHASVSVNYQKTGDQAVAIQLGKERRWGGIHVAALGASWEAGVYNDPTIFFGERETGGEAMIPRLGMASRSVPILKQAAGWYGMDVVPRGSNSGQYMSQVTNLSFKVDVRVRADAGVDRGKLTKEIERSVTRAVDNQAKTLVRELTRRR